MDGGKVGQKLVIMDGFAQENVAWAVFRKVLRWIYARIYTKFCTRFPHFEI